MKAAFVLLFLFGFTSLSKSEEIEDKEVVLGVIRGSFQCFINKLPKVKSFLEEDLPYYHNVHFLSVGGHQPVLSLMNKADQEIEKIELKDLTRQECNDLLVQKGFEKRSEPKVDWPEEEEEDEDVIVEDTTRIEL